MRTPLGSILGYTEMLQEGIYGELTEGQKAATANIITSTGQLLRFINDLLNQAQIETGKIVLKQYPFEPARLLDALDSSVGAFVQAKGLQLLSEVSPDLPDRLIGDSYWLRQIISNLVSNAVKFTEEGVVKVSLSRQDEDYWAIEVSDTGTGIARKDQRAVFDAFQQVEGTTVKAKGIGSGLGLSIVKELTMLMGGTIELTSEEGRGSIFTVLLPVITEQEAASQKVTK
jgi:signal transduction histidine kinase